MYKQLFKAWINCIMCLMCLRVCRFCTKEERIFGKNTAQNPAKNPASFWPDTRPDMQGKEKKFGILATGRNPANFRPD